MRILQSQFRQSLLLILVIHLFGGVVHAQHSTDHVPNVVVVQFETGTDFHGKTVTTGLQVFDRRAATYGVHSIERVYPFLDYVEPTPKTRGNLLSLRRTYYVRYSANKTPQEVSGDLSFAPGIVYAEPIPVNRTFESVNWKRIDPNDPGFREQKELNALNLPAAWDRVKSSDQNPRVVIAIVDGGGEWRHEDLRANVWTNEDEIPNNGLDDDENGFIDDVNGANFANMDHSDPTGLVETPSSANHGTAAAGAAGAVTDNNIGVAGAAWNAELMHINVSCPNSDGFMCSGYEGILYGAANGANIINASWGGGGALSIFINQTINLATDMGALVIAAAGNDNSSIDEYPVYPALHPRVLSVGATNKDTRVRANFSNWGTLVNVFAPGFGIYTTGSNNDYIYIDGTSFSSPLTAGIAALVKTMFPDASPDALREQIRLSAENIDAENPEFEGLMGRGFVNALSAVQEPTLPAIRLQDWTWEDDDGNRIIELNDQVTITINLMNHLADGNQLQVELVGAESYPFVQWRRSESEIGSLTGGDSTEVSFEFTVGANAPPDQIVRFYLHIRDGAFEDVADRISLVINRQLELVHQGLRSFYLSTGGENWTQNDNWNILRVPNDEELANWFGISLNEGLLASLSMENNNLVGVLPPELEMLRNLRFLNLTGNEGLTGSIPHELGNLEKLLRLNLSSNSLSGPIPSELENLSQLFWLDLGDNSLTGVIPSELGNFEELEFLSLSANSLTGSIPSELENLSQLFWLALGDNSLTGVIPSELGNLEGLEVLSLSANSLTGPIPSELGNLEQLRGIYLSRNSLTGSIPSELGNLEQLKGMYLSRNSLSGPIPSELSNLQNLNDLYLHNNLLTGQIPAKIGNLEQLQNLYLYENSLSGSIPTELRNLERLRTLFLDQNSLTGSIPPELGSLQQLEWLNLGYNSLSGEIPSELGNLTQLRYLYLHDNSLSGEIPVELGNLEHLRAIGARFNSLSGPIPPELGNLKQLEGLYLDGNSLTGVIPSELGNLEHLRDLSLATNSFSGPIPSELGNLSSLKSLRLDENEFTGSIPRSFMQLDSLEIFLFGGQNLCAPADDEFQMWLSSIPRRSGPTCRALQFVEDIRDQSFPRTLPISPLTLPEARGGVQPITYTLTPSLPSGLEYDSSNRTIYGIPLEITSSPIPFTFKATDATGVADSVIFNIEVFSPVALEQDGLPESFTVYENYPNPFSESTLLVVDLPWSVTLDIEVFDLIGRSVLVQPSVDLTAGWHQTIRLEGTSLPSGVYFYTIHANSEVGTQTQSGSFVRTR